MRCCDTTAQASAKGITYGPNAQGHFYDSLNNHRGLRKKSKWEITPKEECKVFCAADAGGWSDAQQRCWWSVSNQGTDILGMLGERLSKFPWTVNAQDPRHGYPVFADVKHPQDCPSEVFVEQWLKDGVVTKTTAKRVLAYSL